MKQTSRPTTRRRTSHNKTNQMKQRKIKWTLFFTISLLIVASIAIIMFRTFNSTHFSKGTTISGVDCSWLTVEDAYEKLNESLNEKVITFMFVDDSYSFTGGSINLRVASEEALRQFLTSQKMRGKQLKFSVSSFLLDGNKLSEIMKSLSNFNEELMTYSENAYITQSEDGLLTITPEVIGNYINFDEAYTLAKDGLKEGCSTIDFCPITAIRPQITTENLQPTVDSINAILNTSITFSINDNSSLTIDKSVMKDWITVDELGNYSIDVDSNLPAFVELLAEKSAGSTLHFEFAATGFGTVTVPAKNLSIDKEAEIQLIKSELGSGESYIHTPAYNLSIGNNYVEVDIARQHVWFYKDGVCIVDSDCVTGTRNSHDTREGYFFLTSKETDRILRGYNDNGSKYASHVDFWMPFDGGIGLHDAAWKSAFGGSIYLTNGSHGCVNLPRSAAETIYNNIDYNTPIIVYYSTK